jgi:hypothetical protein
MTEEIKYPVQRQICLRSKRWFGCKFQSNGSSGWRYNFFFLWLNSPQWARASSFTRFLDHTQRRTTVSRTPLNGWSARRRDLYLTTPNTHNRQTSMPPMGIEPTISLGERPQTYAEGTMLTVKLEYTLPGLINTSINNDIFREGKQFCF